MKRGLLWNAGLTALLVLAACGGEGQEPDPIDPPDNNPPAQTRPGLGPSTGTPTGTPYTLPAGITLASPIKGVEFDCTPPEQRTPIFVGRGNTVRICLEFTNTTPGTLTITLPPGLTFVSQKVTTQNGFLIIPAVVNIPPNSKIYANLFLLCLNEKRTPSQGPADTFTVGPVTDDPQLVELTNLVKDKNLRDVLDDGVLQKAVWNVTDGQGLTAEDRAAISRL
jgi:hypothetical protein